MTYRGKRHKRKLKRKPLANYIWIRRGVSFLFSFVRNDSMIGGTTPQDPVPAIRQGAFGHQQEQLHDLLRIPDKAGQPQFLR